MKNIFLSFATIAIVSAVSIGGTVAYFSDTETESITFATGTVKLGEPGGFPLEIEDMAPGLSFQRDLSIQYDGSLPADLYIGVKEDEGEDLGYVLEYRLRRLNDENTLGTWIEGPDWKDFSGEDHLLAQYLKTHSGLEQGDIARARLYIRMKSGDDVNFENIPHANDWNYYQDKQEKITVIFYAVQEGGDAPTDAPRDFGN